MNPSAVIIAALVPLIVAAGAAYACRTLRCAPAASWAAGVALGFIVGQLLMSRAGIAAAMASFAQPQEAAHWLPAGVLLALGITLLSTYPSSGANRLAAILAATLVVALPLRLLAGSAHVTLRWSAFEKITYLALFAGTLGLTWFLLARPRDTDHPRMRPLLFVAVSLGIALVVALSGVLVYGRLCGVVAAALVGTLLASIAHSRHALGASALAGVVTCSLGALILMSCFYAELTTLNASLLFASLMLAGAPTPEHIAGRPAWQQAALRTVLCLAPLAVAIALAAAAAQASMSTNPYAI